MKQVVHGKLYDTETAEKIAYFTNEASNSDFGYIRETLYRTKNGAWFLRGEGGAATQYAEVYAAGKGRSAGEEIIPLDDDEVKNWLELHRKCEVHEKYFVVEPA